MFLFQKFQRVPFPKISNNWTIARENTDYPYRNCLHYFLNASYCCFFPFKNISWFRAFRLKYKLPFIITIHFISLFDFIANVFTQITLNFFKAKLCIWWKVSIHFGPFWESILRQQIHNFSNSLEREKKNLIEKNYQRQSKSLHGKMRLTKNIGPFSTAPSVPLPWIIVIYNVRVSMYMYIRMVVRKSTHTT